MEKWTREMVAEHNEDAILYDEYESAIIGMAYRAGGSLTAVVAYDYFLCVQILMDQGMTYEDAIEYFEYNTIGAWLGDNTPVFIQTNNE